MAKSRIGVVTGSRAEFEKMASNFPDAYFYYGSTVLDLYQKFAPQKPDFVVFHALEKAAEPDLPTSLRYLRGKSEFKRKPFLLLLQDPEFRFKQVMNDPLVRAFSLGSQLFLKIVDFLVATKNVDNLEQAFVLDDGQLCQTFGSAAAKRMGLKEKFETRQATDDETRSSFLFQHTSEISTNLLWVRFSARILEEGNPIFVKMLENYSEEEREDMAKQLIGLIMNDLGADIGRLLDDRGAVRFAHSDEMDFEQRKPFVKTATTRSFVFQSPACNLLFEVTKYI